MGRTRREDVRIEHRRTQAAKLHKKGWTQAAIAEELGVSQATISADLKAIREESSESRIGKLDEEITLQLRRTDILLQEAGLAWERSRQPVTTVRIIQRNGHRRVEKTIRQRPGDPRFLQIGFRAIETRCKLQGMGPSVSEQWHQESIDAEVTRRFWGVWNVLVFKRGPRPDVLDEASIRQLVASLGDQGGAARRKLRESS